MSVTLRRLLLLGAVITVVWILRKIRKLKVKMEDAIFWLAFSLVLLVFAAFPRIAFWLSRVMGIESPANLVFLMIICLLLEKIFTLSMITSQLEDKVSVLSAEVALRSQAQQREIENIQDEEGKGETHE